MKLPRLSLQYIVLIVGSFFSIVIIFLSLYRVFDYFACVSEPEKRGCIVYTDQPETILETEFVAASKSYTCDRPIELVSYEMNKYSEEYYNFTPIRNSDVDVHCHISSTL